MKKIISLLLSLSLALTLIPAAVLADESGSLSKEETGVSSEQISPTVLAAAHSHEGWTAWGDDATEQSSLPKTSGNYYLTKSLSNLSATSVASAQTITLCLNGYSISAASGARIYSLSKSANVTITDCAGTLGTITIGTPLGGLANVNAATLNIENVKVDGTGITRTKNGGALFIQGGGKATAVNVSFSNITSSVAENSTNTTFHGGAIYVSNGSATLDNCSFANCAAADSYNGTAACGGAISLNGTNASVSLNDVTITGCSAPGKGGAIEVYKGTLSLSGACVIKNNTDSSDNPSDIYLVSGALVNISGAEAGMDICINTADSRNAGSAIANYTGDELVGSYTYNNDTELEVALESGQIVLYEKPGEGTWTETASLPTSGTWKLGADVSVSQTYTVASAGLTLDLNGHSITLASSNNGIYKLANNSKAQCTITNSKSTGGLKGDGTTRDNCLLFVQEYAKESASLTIENIKFTTNYTSNSYGGSAVKQHGPAKVTITGCTFTGLYATRGAGGAIYEGGKGVMEITNCSFTSNVCSSNGGAIYAAGKATITNCTFTNNRAYYHDGGAIYSAGNVTATGCSFSGNTADENGAALAIQDNTISADIHTLTLNGATLTGATTSNSAFYSGYRSELFAAGNITVSYTDETNQAAVFYGAEKSLIELDGAAVTGASASGAIETLSTLKLKDADVDGNVDVLADKNMWGIQMDAMAIVSGGTVADITLYKTSESWYSSNGGDAETSIVMIQDENLTEAANIRVTIPDGESISDYVFGPYVLSGGTDNTYTITYADAIPGTEYDGDIVHSGEYSYNLSGAGLTIGKSYSVEFMVNTTDENSYMQYYFEGESTAAGDTDTVLNGISPRQMTLSFDARLYSYDGVKQLECKDFSVCRYVDMLYSIIKESNDEYNLALKELLASMVKLGSYCQLYTEYRTDNLPETGRNWVSSCYNEYEQPAAPTLTNTGSKTSAKVTGAGIAISDYVKLYFNIKAPENATIKLLSSTDGKSFKSIANTTVAKLLAADEGTVHMTGSDGRYTLYTAGISAADTAQIYKLIISVNGSTQNTVTYSALNYINKNWNSTDENLAGLVKALYSYGKSAEKLTALVK